LRAWGTTTSDGFVDGKAGRAVAISSSEEYGFSGAVLKESAREEGYRSAIGGRNASGIIARGGVPSGVGGLLWFGGVQGTE
jgi:hypothetical protein